MVSIQDSASTAPIATHSCGALLLLDGLVARRSWAGGGLLASPGECWQSCSCNWMRSARSDRSSRSALRLPPRIASRPRIGCLGRCISALLESVEGPGTGEDGRGDSQQCSSRLWPLARCAGCRMTTQKP